MTALQLNSQGAEARPGLFDRWTHVGLLAALAPLLAWDAVSVFLLAWACSVPWYVAWIPAISTSGMMLASGRISENPDVDERVRRHAKRFAYFSAVLGMGIAAIHLALPEHIARPHWAVLALIGGLPVAMGTVLWHIRSQARYFHELKLAAQQAQAIARAETEASAEQARITAARDQAAQIEHARVLATIATQQATAEASAADAATRRLAAERKLASEVADVTAGPRPVPGRKSETSPGRQAPLRKAAITELTRRHRAGQDISRTVSAELDRTIGASVGYSKKIIGDLVAAVLQQERRAS